jgi:hypothetical protein
MSKYGSLEPVKDLPQLYKVVQMCPDPQLLSIYMDGELPSPWKEKMEAHLAECSVCKGNYDNFKKLQEHFKKDNHQWRTVVELAERDPQEPLPSERELMERSKERVWRSLETKQRFRKYSVWKRRFSIPMPAVAAAAVVIALLAVVMLRGNPFSGSFNNNYNLASQQNIEPVNIFIAEEDNIPDITPVSDISGILQYLGASDTNVIILQLPESKNFSRSGEPAIIRAADYSGRRP